MKLILSQHHIINTISIKTVATISNSLLFLSLILAFTIGYSVHHDLLYNYKWICDKTFLPSVSRVINLPVERVVFQLAILVYIPLRSLTIFTNWCYSHKTSVAQHFPYKFIQILMLIFGYITLFFLLLLTLVGEREQGVLHVVFFCLFTLFAFCYMISHWLTMRSETLRAQTLHDLRRNIIISLSVIIIVLFWSFTIYHLFCVPYGYEFFASCEYITILGMITYNCLEFNEMCGVIKVIHPKF